MGDVVSIEVDGELGPPAFEGERRPPRWGMRLAAVLVVGLLVALGWSLRPSEGSSQAQVSPATTRIPSSPSTTAAASAISIVPAAPDPIESARAALEAWGRFAGSGDLTELGDFFAADSPQLAQLRSEIDAIVGGAPYRVVLENASASDTAEGVTTVTGDVTWTRDVEQAQHFRWEIDLRRAAAGWLLVTVRTVT